MKLLTRTRRLLVAAGLVFLTANLAPAGWITIKNETRTPLVVHYVPDGPVVKRGKMVRLLPGEVYREYQPRAGQRQVQILDAHAGARLLYEAKVKWPAEDVSLRIRQESAAVKLHAVRPQKPGGPEVVITTATPPRDR